MYKFRKINKKEAIFITTLKQYESTYWDFRKYAEYLTIQQGKATEESGKARSYADWIIRIIIFCNEQADKPLTNLLHIHTLSQLEAMMQLSQFKQFNQKESRFPQAAIKQFLKYTSYKAQTEDIQDYMLNDLSDEVHETIATYRTKQPTDTPRLRKEKIEGKFGYGYPRSLAESNAAKTKSQWHCEYDYSHQTFIAKDGHPYVEAHHLIPMAQQDFFELNIDIAPNPNIVALCPTCHRNIHFGQPEAKKQMLQKLFNDRRLEYEALEIPITFQQLLAFYYIFE